MVDQSTSNTGIPHPSSGQTWYQSFTAEHSSKLQKFAFVTNGAFTASATVKIREGEGVTGTVLHTGTWTGIGSNTNNYNEYVVGNGVVLTQGQKYTIQAGKSDRRWLHRIERQPIRRRQIPLFRLWRRVR